MAEAVLEELREFADMLLRQSRLQLDASIDETGGEVVVDLSGPDADLVLTENARLLYALNHLVSQAFYRRARGEYRFVVDCEGYRGARARELQMLADKAAEKAQQSGRPFRFQPMPANDRRIIHLHLAEEEKIRTESDGRGMHRRVIVIPDA